VAAYRIPNAKDSSFLFLARNNESNKKRIKTTLSGNDSIPRNLYMAKVIQKLNTIFLSRVR
jgi:hypothetical protein